MFSTVTVLFYVSSPFNTQLGQTLDLFKGFAIWLAANAPQTSDVDAEVKAHPGDRAFLVVATGSGV